MTFSFKREKAGHPPSRRPPRKPPPLRISSLSAARGRTFASAVSRGLIGRDEVLAELAPRGRAGAQRESGGTEPQLEDGNLGDQELADGLLLAALGVGASPEGAADLEA